MAKRTTASKNKVYDMTAREAAAQLGVNPETIKRWAREERVPARKDMSGFWRFAAADLDGLPIRGVVESARA